MSHAPPSPVPTSDDAALNTTDPSDRDGLPMAEALLPVTSTTGPHQNPDNLGLVNNTTGPHQGE